MKKLFFYAALFAAGFAVTSCSSDNDEVDSQLQKGDGFVSLAINLPSTSTLTRAANDNFDDGLTQEYAVNDVTIVLFNGNTGSSTVQAVYSPTLSWNKEGTSTDQVTTVAKLIQSVTYSSTSYYALVILNKPSSLTISTGQTWTQVQALTLSTTVATPNTALVQGTMMMANAPLANDDGGTNDPSSATVATLVEIPSSSIYATEAEARSSTPIDVYVERVAAKVTIANASGTTTTGSLAWSLAGWMLDNTNPSSYAVRSTDGMTSFFPLHSNLVVNSGNIVDGTNEYRFVGSSPVATGKALYRTYWAKDPNYDADATLLDFTGQTFSTSYGETNPMYCFENTFDVAHQTHHNTTRVVVQVQFNSGSDCFTVNGDAANVYATKTDMETAVKAFILGNADMADLIATAGNIDVTNANYIANSNKVGASNITLTWTSTTTAGTWTLSDIAFDCLTAAGSTAYTATTSSGTFKSDLIAAVNAAAVVSCYKNGISYYPIRIKHFGDDLTPWSAAAHRTASSSYYDEGSSTISRYLGRYGVLRNNWYHLNITSISQIGSPTCPAVPTTSKDVPDDEVYSYIAVKINILSWAKRTQDVTL